MVLGLLVWPFSNVMVLSSSAFLQTDVLVGLVEAFTTVLLHSLRRFVDLCMPNIY